jgi:hypothetical protein
VRSRRVQSNLRDQIVALPRQGYGFALFMVNSAAASLCKFGQARFE